MLLLFLTLAAATSAFEFQDAFDYADGVDTAPPWFTESVVWEVRDGALVCESPNRTFAILEKAPHGKEVSLEATVTVHQRAGTEWAIAGVCIRRDAGNYWHLAFVEAPEAEGGRHYVELVEGQNDQWLAQTAEGSRLSCLAHEGGDFNWAYGKPYRLRIAMTPERIDGFVLDAEGSERAHLAYAFDNRAVTSGQPALDCGNFRVSFNDVTAAVDQETPPPEITTTSPPYGAPGNPAVTAKATGFFYPTEVDGRWWLIDPNGQGFYMVGTDHASYHVHWCEKLGYAPYARNVAEKYGSEDKWADTTAQRLAAWGFNTLPANHSHALRHRQFPHIEFLAFGTTFSPIDDICPRTTWTGVPNVFSPKWPAYCDKMARQLCAPVKDDPWLIGHFLDNELEWFGKTGQPWGLFDEAWKKPAGHTAKRAWVDFITRELETPGEFATHWGVDIGDFADLAGHVAPAMPRTEKARAVAEQWVRLIADKYFSTCAEAIRRHDPNHLILGCRFAGNAPDIWDIAGKYCDIVSFNMYPRIDVEQGVPASVVETIEGWQRKAGRPMMITEWSFPALDSGLPCVHGAGMRVDTQAQRAQCFTHFQTLMFSLPFMVGSNYFMWADEPALGISETFPEDTNYGLVNEKDEPYPELTEAARALNPRVYELHAASGPRTSSAAAALAPWLHKLPEKMQPVPETLALSAGALGIEGPAGDRVWRFTLGGTLLGDFRGMMHQVTPQPLWVACDAARIVALRQNERVSMVDMDLCRGDAGQVITQVEEKTGTPDAQRQRPRRYRSRWRFWIPRNMGSWMASACLWVENTDNVAWTLEDVFHYTYPALGGDPAGDVSLMAKATNYYRRGGAWIDAAAGVGLGCWYADTEAFECRYWQNPQGGFHADLYQRIGVVLEPGQRYAVGGQPAFFFSLDDVSLAGFSKAAQAVAEAVLQQE